MKYNKKISARLNINKEHFEKYIILKEFNQKFNTTIKDFDIKELDKRKRYRKWRIKFFNENGI